MSDRERNPLHFDVFQWSMTPIVVAAFAAGMVSTVNPCGFANFNHLVGTALDLPEAPPVVG